MTEMPIINTANTNNYRMFVGDDFVDNSNANDYIGFINNNTSIIVNSWEKEEGKKMKKRIVKVFIVDPNENVSLEDSLLYKGEEKLTDLTNQELFFEINIKEILDKHNEKRIKIIDKKMSKDGGQDIFLGPVKIRDLVMTVITVAEF